MLVFKEIKKTAHIISREIIDLVLHAILCFLAPGNGSSFLADRRFMLIARFPFTTQDSIVFGNVRIKLRSIKFRALVQRSSLVCHPQVVSRRAMKCNLNPPTKTGPIKFWGKLQNGNKHRQNDFDIKTDHRNFSYTSFDRLCFYSCGLPLTHNCKLSQSNHS